MNNDNNGYEENGVVSDFVKFNKVGDYVQGVWVDAFTPDKPDRFGKIERKLSIKATAGLWHDTDGSKVEAEVGSVYRISEKSAIAAQLKKTPMGAEPAPAVPAPLCLTIFNVLLYLLNIKILHNHNLLMRSMKIMM